MRKFAEACLFLLFLSVSIVEGFEGFGAITNGALDDPDGWEYYHVTTLDDTTMYQEGTLRYGVFREGNPGQEKGQYIVFDVAGTIYLGTEYRLKAGSSYITIDGSTAPKTVQKFAENKQI